METQKSVKQLAQDKLKALGFKVDKRLGMNILKHEEGQTLVLKINSEIFKYEAKNAFDEKGNPKIYDYVLVDNVETGETGLTYWLSGQVRYNLQSQEDGFIGGIFAITHLGQTKVDGQYINQFDILALKNDEHTAN